MALEIDDTDRTIEEVEAEYDKATAVHADGLNPWPGMTYVQGVRDTLAWIMGDSEDAPLVDLDDD